MLRIQNKEAATAFIKDLPYKTSKEIRSLYYELFGKKPTNLTSTKKLLHPIAYKIQERLFGGLSERVENKIINKLKNMDIDTSIKILMPGTIIKKYYNGDIHEVTVQVGHFIYNGTRYASLSGVAKAITGAHWNGRNFFKC